MDFKSSNKLRILDENFGMCLNEKEINSLPVPVKLFFQIFYWEDINMKVFKRIPYFPNESLVSYCSFKDQKEVTLIKKISLDNEFEYYYLEDLLEELNHNKLRNIKFLDIINYLFSYDKRTKFQVKIKESHFEFKIDDEYYLNLYSFSASYESLSKFTYEINILW